MINQAGDMEAYRNTLNVVMKDSKKAGKMFAWATDFANKTPFETDDVVQGTVRLQSYGLEAQKLIPTIGDMASVMNTDLMQAVEAVADAQTGETERLKAFGITKDMIANQGKKMGFDVINKKGQITDLNKFNAALQKVMKTRFGGGMEKQAKTFKGAMSTVSGVAKNALAQIAGVASNGDIIKGSLFDSITKGAVKLGNVLQDLSKSGILTSIGSTIGNGLKIVIGIGSKAFSTIYKVIDALSKAPSLTFGVATQLEKVFNSDTAWGISNVIGYIEFGIKGLIQFLKGNISEASNMFYTMFEDEEATTGKVQTIISFLQTFVSTAKTIGSNILSVGQSVITNGITLFETVKPYVLQFAGSVLSGIQTILPYISTVSTTICNAVSNILPIINQVVTFFVSHVFPILSQIVQFICTYIIPVISNAIATIVPMIVNAIQGIVNFLQPIATVIMGIIGFVVPYVEQTILFAVTTISGAIQSIIQVISGILEFVGGVFSLNWQTAWQGIVDIFGGIFSGIVGLVKAPVNAVISLINSAIGGINSISVDIPDWVPGLGGKHFGTNIPQIPMLAKGGFANTPSICGEAGPEAVIPLKRNNSRSIQLLAETSQKLGLGNLQANKLTNRKAEVLSKFDSGRKNNVKDNTPIVINYSPKFEGINTNTKEEIKNMQKQSFEEFKEYIRRYFEEEGRLEFE